VLCLPPRDCRAACAALGAACRGFEVSALSDGRCRLWDAAYGNETATPALWQGGVSQGWHSFPRAAASCSFEEIGTIHVSARMHLGIDYVVAPNTPASIQVVRPAAAHENTTGLGTKDRILVAPCGSSCPPTQDPLPLAGGWWQLAPSNIVTRDIAHTDEENPLEEVENVAPLTPGFVGTLRVAERYCPGNLDWAALSNGAELRAASCAVQCAEGCEGEDCFCDGYLAGYDASGAQLVHDHPLALCATEAGCKELCARTDGCGSIDMHRTLPRCFLNRAQEFVEGVPFAQCKDEDLMKDSEYDLLREDLDVCGERLASLGRGYDPKEWCESADTSEGHGLSFSCCYSAAAGRCAKCADRVHEAPGRVDVLTFAPVQFPAGTYTVCGCDAELDGDGDATPCRTPQDFTLHVGVLHSSGVQCLLGDTRLARATCTPQSDGGLRCE
jgi:hypothetical protein